MAGAQPRPFVYDPGCTALLVIDMQHDFLHPDGWAAAAGLDVALLAPAVPVVGALLTAARGAGMKIIHTREGYRPDLADCPQRKRERHWPRVGDGGKLGRYMVTGEAGNSIIPALSPLPGEPVIDKPGAGAFHATLLDQILRLNAITHLIVCGVTADVCVNTTIREANDRGYECLLIEDATASYDADFTRWVIAMLRIGVAGGCAPASLFIASLEHHPTKRDHPPDKDAR